MPATHEPPVPLAELLRKVAPGAACSRDPQHSFNEQPVVVTTTARIAGFAQTMRFHLRPLGVRQNESIHQKLESHQASKGNPDSQQTLALQLLFLKASQSMGNHDSNIVDAGRVD